MTANIITIGDEILIGQVIDTNSAWIGEKLNMIGIRVNRILSVSDEKASIVDAITESLNKADITIITGGLGPTKDDITKGVLLGYFGGKMVIHKPTQEQIELFFRRRGLPVTEVNLKQAEVPDTCNVLPNRRGTAPGMWFIKNGKDLISLPGVPFEMKTIMEEEVLPKLASANKQLIVHQTIQTFGLPESFLADKLSDWESSLPANIKLAYLPSPSSIRLRLSAYGSRGDDLNGQVSLLITSLNQIIPKYIFGFGEITLQEVVGLMLKEIGANLSVAESCTGGTISHLITQIPGSSRYFVGGVVAYSNELKTELLSVDTKLIHEFGAVSQQVVESMAIGVKRRLNTAYSIAISGIAGPEGGSEQKPVGTVWIAVNSEKNLVSKEFKFGNDRGINIQRSASTALNMLRLLLIQEHPDVVKNIFPEKFE